MNIRRCTRSASAPQQPVIYGTGRPGYDTPSNPASFRPVSRIISGSIDQLNQQKTIEPLSIYETGIAPMKLNKEFGLSRSIS
jgi:hypothetical protein